MAGRPKDSCRAGDAFGTWIAIDAVMTATIVSVLVVATADTTINPVLRLLVIASPRPTCLVLLTEAVSATIITFGSVLLPPRPPSQLLLFGSFSLESPLIRFYAPSPSASLRPSRPPTYLALKPDSDVAIFSRIRNVFRRCHVQRSLAQ